MDCENEIRLLERRISDLEGAVKALTGQLGQVLPELAGLGEITSKSFDGVNMSMDRVVTRLDSMNSQVWSLRDDMPILMAQAMALTRKKLD